MAFYSRSKQARQELQRKAQYVLRSKELMDLRANKLITTISTRTGMSAAQVELRIQMLANDVGGL